ncbi:MAG: transcriptional repressor [Phycisphaera sp.]|nr:transcriptional repressor [Phycisphaera sp.]
MSAPRKPRATTAARPPASAQEALGRTTRQRSALLAIIAREARPLSPYELHELAVRELPSISQSTVYRNLRALEAAREIHAVSIPGQQPRYELAEIASHHHHHFHCRGCDRVYDLEGCPGGLRGLLPRGFTLEEHTIVLSGKCRTCAA